MTAKNRDGRNPTALEERAQQGARRFSPSAARNRDPIRAAFLEHMPLEGRILEIGAGTGEHAVHMAAATPALTWRTGDPDRAARASIAAWIAEAGLPNLKGPHAAEVTADEWGVEDEAPFDGLVSINMIHIAPFAAAKGLFNGAHRLLRSGGKLFLYGPFSRGGVHVAPSNEAFDASLKARDARWGVRDIDTDLTPLAQTNALRLKTIVEMPANNMVLIFCKK